MEKTESKAEIVPDHDIHNLIRERWSPRAFQERIPEDQELKILFEAARWAPSSFNEQPWRFIYAKRGTPAFEKLCQGLNPGNAWAKEVPVLMLSIAKSTFSKNGKPNRHSWHDLGQAMAMLSIQATALDLYVHQMGGFSPEIARSNFNIPDDFDPVAMVAIGYLGKPEQLSEDQQKSELAPRRRNKIEDFAFEGGWKNS